MWISCIGLVLLRYLPAVVTSERVVYPRLLQARAAGEDQLLYVDGRTLSLRKASVLAEQLPVISFEDGQPKRILVDGSEIEKNLYADAENFASVMMHNTEAGLTVDGLLDRETRIEPLREQARSTERGVPHRVYRIKMSKPGHYAPMDARMMPPTQPVERRFVSQRAATLESVTVEVCVISDMVHHHGMNAVQLSAYFAIFFTAMKLWFHQLREPTVTFRIVTVVMSTEEDERQYLTMHGKYLDADAVLKNLYDYKDYLVKLLNVPKPGGGLAEPDILFLFTGRDLVARSGNTKIASFAGLAYVGGMCMFWNSGVVEDPYSSYEGVYKAVHEMAHLLGTPHDGDGPVGWIYGSKGANDSDCAYRHGHIMSYAHVPENKNKFSRCSLREMKNFLSNHVTLECVTVFFTNDVLKKYLNLLPGVVLKQTALCISRNPDWTNVKYIENSLKDEKCFVTCTGYKKGTNIRQTGFTRAVDGMWCAINKTCIRGICTKNNQE